MVENIVSLLKKINSISFIQVINDEGRTVLFIPAWTVAVAVFLLVLLRRSRRAKA
jgi:hypothetical protein